MVGHRGLDSNKGSFCSKSSAFTTELSLCANCARTHASRRSPGSLMPRTVFVNLYDNLLALIKLPIMPVDGEVLCVNPCVFKSLHI